MTNEYYCKWCEQKVDKKQHHLYCSKNPDGSDNYAKLKKRNKDIYEKHCRKKLAKAAHTPEAKLKRKKTVKKNWEAGVYDNVDFGSRFEGKKHSLSLRLKQSIGMVRFWKKQEPQLLQNSLEKHNVISPNLSTNINQHKTVIGGEFFEEDFVDYIEEYDPFK